MEDLPESLLLEILRRIDRTADRNSLSLVCKHLHRVERRQRDFLRVGCGLHPATEALTALCIRFPNLSKLEIVYSGWKSSKGEQLDNEGMKVLSSNCPLLTDLSLSLCSFIDDTGLYYISSCRHLLSLKLIFTPAVSSNGIISVVLGCKSLSVIELIGCKKVKSTEWLELFGKFGNLRGLCIKNCRFITENDLLKLGLGWRKLQRLEFEVDAYPKVHDQLLFREYHREMIYCDELKELSLTNCKVSPGQSLSFVLGRCAALEKLHLDMCIGLANNDIVALSHNSRNLRRLSLRPSSQLLGSLLEDHEIVLNDDSLRALSAGCPMLDMFELSFCGSSFSSISSFTQDAVIALIQSCPIRVLNLSNACFFNDTGMQTLCSAQNLQVLELSNCQEVSDEGLQHVLNSPSLRILKLYQCLRVTDNGLKPLIESQKLDLLVVKDCLRLVKCIKGVVTSMSFKVDSL